MKLYVASSWRNDLQAAVVEKLRNAGHEVYDFKNPRPGSNGFHWSEIDPEWKQWTPEQFRDCLHHPIAVKGYVSDYDAMTEADGCVLVLPCGRSAHLEAGWFAGRGQPVFVLMTTPQEPELMYRMTEGIVVSMEELLERIERFQREEYKIFGRSVS